VVPIHTIGTVTFRSDILQCVMSVAVSTVAVTVRARSGHKQAKDLSLTVRALNRKSGLADALEVGECRQSAIECVT